MAALNKSQSRAADMASGVRRSLSRSVNNLSSALAAALAHGDSVSPDAGHARSSGASGATAQAAAAAQLTAHAPALMDCWGLERSVEPVDESLLALLFAGCVPRASVLVAICNAAERILCEEANVVSLRSPRVVVGDVFGQFDDLLEVFLIAGRPPDVNFVFLGNYANHGLHGVETFALLLALKVRFPLRVTLLRGNHDTERMADVFGFRAEVARKYRTVGAGDRVWASLMRVMNALPYGATIDETVLCLHGGLSPSLESLAQLQCVDRFRDIPTDGVLADLVWSQPSQSADERSTFWLSSSGVGYNFGASACESFLDRNHLALLVRSGPPLPASGFASYFNSCLYSLSSPPNLQYKCANVAAILLVFEDGVDVVYYHASPGNLATMQTNTHLLNACFLEDSL